MIMISFALTLTVCLCIAQVHSSEQDTGSLTVCMAMYTYIQCYTISLFIQPDLAPCPKSMWTIDSLNENPGMWYSNTRIEVHLPTPEKVLLFFYMHSLNSVCNHYQSGCYEIRSHSGL